MSDFGEHIQGMTTPYTQDSSGAQTNKQRNAVARIESCPRSYPAGAVAPKGARFTNPEIFRRGWKSAGPPHPELLPDIDDSDGANAILTTGKQRVYCLSYCLK